MAEHTKEQAAADQTLITETPSQPDPKQPSDNASPSKDGAQHGDNRTKTFLVLIGIVFTLAFLMYGAFLAGQKSVDVDRGRLFTMRSLNGDIELMPGQIGNNGSTTDGYGPRGGMMRGGWDSDDTSTSTSSTRLSGVVTAVSGDTITVAGGGTTTKVTATGSTNYTGSSEPAKVNDSIVVVGTQNSDGSLTATSIRLVRN